MSKLTDDGQPVGGPDKSAEYQVVLAQLELIPVITWACNYAGVTRQAFHAKRQRDAEFDIEVRKAVARGQLVQLPKCSPERILSWSDPETFGLHSSVDVQGGVVVNITNPDALALDPEPEQEQTDDDG